MDDELDDGFEEDDESTEGTASRTRSAPSKAKPPAKSRTGTGDERGPNIFARLLRFVREVVAELQKVIWPTRKELITYSTVVVVFVTIVATLVTLLDLGFAQLILLVFGTSADATPTTTQ
jgi:preprotein translocase subunit SecE